MTNQQPRLDDAVLGGQTQAPLDAAVLGGIEGVRQKLASDNEVVKKEGILQALNYGEKGIEALFGVLEQERNLNIQWLAHQTLAKQGNPVIEARLKNYFPWYEYESVMVNRRGEVIKRTPGRARYYREDLGNGVYLDMVYIAGGSFLMGAPESEYGSLDSERPQHWVTVPDFWMGKYQVTTVQWLTQMDSEHCYRRRHFHLPIWDVSWNDCQEFCRRVSEKTGKNYRLPSEAEWEYACRAGTSTPFNFGKTITSKLAQYSYVSTYAEETAEDYPAEEIADLGNFSPNAWGLYDMHGNVNEWCSDDWHDSYHGAPINGSSWKNNLGLNNAQKVLRGGSFCQSPEECRSSARIPSTFPSTCNMNNLFDEFMCSPSLRLVMDS